MLIPGPDSTTGSIHFFLLILALALDAAAGNMGGFHRWLPHPVVVMGSCIDWFDQRLNRGELSHRERVFRGALTVLVMVALSGLAGWGVMALGRVMPYGWVIELLAVTSLLAQRSLFDHVLDVARGLRDSGVAGGRRAVRHIVGRDPTSLDRQGISRAAIESLAENFCDGVVAPVFWYVLLGLPGLAAYKCVNTMDSMIGYRTERYSAFGSATARLDDVLNTLPARLAGLFISLAAIFLPRPHPIRSLRIMWRDARKHHSPNSGWPEAAMAGGLGVALAGPRYYGGVTVHDPWLGEEFDAYADTFHIHRALYLYVVACVIDFTIVVILLLLT